MNNPNPLSPQGSLLECKNHGRSRLKLAVFIVVGIHVVGLTVLLMQGCKREEPTPPPPPPMIEETSPPVTPQFEPTNPPPVMPTNPPPGTGAGPEVLPPVPPPVIPTAPPPSEVTGEMRQHSVQKGDSFYTLAKKYGVTSKAIEAANPGVDSRKLKIDQKLNIPPAASTPAPGASPSATTGAAPETGETTYVVKSGDTLTKIAKRVGVSVKALRAENNLTTDRITVGQKLKIPAKAAPPAPAPTPTSGATGEALPPAPAPTSAPPAR